MGITLKFYDMFIGLWRNVQYVIWHYILKRALCTKIFFHRFYFSYQHLFKSYILREEGNKITQKECLQIQVVILLQYTVAKWSGEIGTVWSSVQLQHCGIQQRIFFFFLKQRNKRKNRRKKLPWWKFVTESHDLDRRTRVYIHQYMAFLLQRGMCNLFWPSHCSWTRLLPRWLRSWILLYIIIYSFSLLRCRSLQFLG